MSSELWRRIGFTVGALLVFRLGTYIPIPGIDSRVLAELFRGQSGGPLGMAVLFSGGAVRRVAIFSLSLMPYLTAAILLQLVSLAVRPLRALPKQGEHGRRRLDSYTLALTIVIAIVQSFGIAFGLEGAGIVPEPGWMFRLTTVTTLTGGTVFLIWLCGQITARGLGNGLSLILLLGIILELPPVVAGALEIGQRGLLPPAVLAGIALLAIALRPWSCSWSWPGSGCPSPIVEMSASAPSLAGPTLRSS
jgi:preprotein translocase subunit SecY